MLKHCDLRDVIGGTIDGYGQRRCCRTGHSHYYCVAECKFLSRPAAGAKEPDVAGATAAPRNDRLRKAEPGNGKRFTAHRHASACSRGHRLQQPGSGKAAAWWYAGSDHHRYWCWDCVYGSDLGYGDELEDDLRSRSQPLSTSSPSMSHLVQNRRSHSLSTDLYASSAYGEPHCLY